MQPRETKAFDVAYATGYFRTDKRQKYENMKVLDTDSCLTWHGTTSSWHVKSKSGLRTFVEDRSKNKNTCGQNFNQIEL